MTAAPRSPAPALATSLALAAALAACGAQDQPRERGQSVDPPPEEPVPASGGFGRWFRRDRGGAWSFDFKDPGPGPRAPSRMALSAELGRSRVADVEALTKSLGLTTCSDTSVRATMALRRAAERERLAAARAAGQDAVTSASWLEHKSKREANPQVRYSCPKTASAQLKDRPRPPSEGRLLYVFDSAEHPLRHASFQRTHVDGAAALADVLDALDHFSKVFGPPTKSPGRELPTPGADGRVEFPPAVNFETEWSFADVVAKVTVMRYGGLVTVGERVEVPHGIRPDAPVLGAPGGSPPRPPSSP